VLAAFRAESPRIVGTLTRLLGDLSLAEDAASEAFAAALERWPRDGVPDNPGAWLMTTARHRAIDALRRDRVLAAKREALLRLSAFDAPGPESLDEPSVPDDRLALVFTCCHPALAAEARVALTLRLVGGLTTEEIAALFLVPVPTMAARITRAKKKIRVAGIPFRVPDDHELPDRLGAALAVVYLMFTEGYAATPVRASLCEEAIRLGRVLLALMPDEPEVAGLLALMLLQHARSAARVDPAGGLVLLRDQDRSRWDAALVAEGGALVSAAVRSRRVGRYQLEAAIAAQHSSGAPDWADVAALYALLRRVHDTPFVALNAAVAEAECGRVAEALASVDALAEPLAAYHLFHATRADLLGRLGRRDEARAAYERALSLATDPAERRFLMARLAAYAAPNVVR
jgi:RNA polymerase sigma-70 factor (ECF subfamily)